MQYSLYGRKWLRTKPGRGAQINLAHPLARGLAVVLLYNENSGPPFVQGPQTFLTLGSGSPSWAPGAAGIGYQYGSPGAMLSGTAGVLTQTSVDRSFFSVFEVSALPPAGKLYWVWGLSAALAGTGGSRQGILGIDSTGAIDMMDYDGAVKHATTTATAAINTIITAGGVTRSGVGIKAYLNGVPSAQTVFGTAQTWTPTYVNADVDDSALNYTIVSGAAVMRQYCAYHWTRWLTDAEMAWLYMEPFAFFQPQGPRVPWFAPAAATPPAGDIVIFVQVC